VVGLGDGAMPRCAPRCARVFEVKNAAEIEVAARELWGAALD
jgi:hypothetical protein